MQAVNWLERREIPSRSSDLQRDRNRRGRAGRTDRAGHDVERPRRNRQGDILATSRHLQQIPDDLDRQPKTTTTISQINEPKTCMPSFLPTMDGDDPEDSQRHQSHHPEQAPSSTARSRS